MNPNDPIFQAMAAKLDKLGLGDTWRAALASAAEREAAPNTVPPVITLPPDQNAPQGRL
jgi:hypothetical protein